MLLSTMQVRLPSFPSAPHCQQLCQKAPGDMRFKRDLCMPALRQPFRPTLPENVMPLVHLGKAGCLDLKF